MEIKRISELMIELDNLASIRIDGLMNLCKGILESTGEIENRVKKLEFQTGGDSCTPTERKFLDELKKIGKIEFNHSAKPDIILGHDSVIYNEYFPDIDFSDLVDGKNANF